MCLAFKIPSPTILLQQVSANELAVWYARYRLEPFDKSDIHAARILHAIHANLGGTKNKAEDYIHNWYSRETIADVETKIKMYFGIE